MTGRRLFVAGAGSAGTALALGLVRAGRPLEELACRSIARADARRALLGAGTALTMADLADAERDPGPGPALLLIAVPDRIIAETAAALAGRPWPDRSVALHLSGSEEVGALAPLRAAGVATGGLHPLKSFVDPERDAASFAGTVFAIEGDDDAVLEARTIAEQLGGRALLLPPGSRGAWHGAATHACNHLVALVDQALDLIETTGLPRDEARAALMPLLEGTLGNLSAHPPGRALTGPVVRGDVQAVKRHLAAVAGVAPDVGEAYRALAARLVALARDHRGLPGDVADELVRLLDRETGA